MKTRGFNQHISMLSPVCLSLFLVCLDIFLDLIPLWKHGWVDGGSVDRGRCVRVSVRLSRWGPAHLSVQTQRSQPLHVVLHSLHGASVRSVRAPPVNQKKGDYARKHTAATPFG